MAPGRNAAQVIYADLGLDFRATVGAHEQPSSNR
jgi:hypothetical protein